MFKLFWPEVRGNYFFRNRRTYMDFLKGGDGRIYYVPHQSLTIPAFALVGNWRDRSDITALWYVKGSGMVKKSLVMESAKECFEEGSEKMVTKLLSEYEAAEFRQWGFTKACRIVLFEKRFASRPGMMKEPAAIRISSFKKSMLEKVLQVDSSSFDDFWKLDDRTLEAIAASCRRNVFLVAQRGNEVVGYVIAGANGSLGYLQRLGVTAVNQGQGTGEMLSSAALRMLYDMGARVAMVNTQEDNQTGLRLYEKLGFQELLDTRYIMQYAASDHARGL